MRIGIGRAIGAGMAGTAVMTAVHFMIHGGPGRGPAAGHGGVRGP